MILHEVDFPKDIDFLEYKAISDTHIGDPNFDDQLLQEDIDWCKEEEYRRILLNGDILNCATVRSVSDTYSNKLTPHQELKYARKAFEPVKDHIDGMVTGNHERRIQRDDGVDLSEELALSLGTFYQPEGLILKVRFGKRTKNHKKQVYTIYQTHGFTGSRMVGGKANRLQKLRNIVVADIYIVSHSHQKITFPMKIHLPDLYNNVVREVTQTFVNTGAYLKYGGYGQVKSYSPTDRGTPTIRLYGKKKKVEVIM